MADDVTLPGTGTVVETLEQPDGAHRQTVAIAEMVSAAFISALNKIANPMAFDPSVAAMRVYIPTGVSAGQVSIASGTLTTVSNVANITAIGSQSANTLVTDMMQTAWALNVRARIT
jgi:hypothetical protein